MNYWLLKTEPEEYSWDDLVKEKRCVWDGVKAPKAIKNIANMKIGDKVFIYHTGKERKIIGTAEVVSNPYPDPSQQHTKYLVVDISPISKLINSVSLKQIKEIDKIDNSSVFSNWDLIRLPRLSVIPVTKEQWSAILSLAQKGQVKT
jgi:predicted RNA-binding protein with PUA-like domain